MWRAAGIALAVRGFVHYSSGQIEDARIDYNQLLASAHQRANREHEGWATSFSIPVLIAQGKVDEARKMAGAAWNPKSGRKSRDMSGGMTKVLSMAQRPQ